jgi:CO/xanthine dehydrogenase FAD-binding subunit
MRRAGPSVKPAAFEYFDPTTVEEAVGLLARYGDEAKALAGGQSLVPLMNFRLAQPRYVVDLGRVASLRYISREANGLRIGAMTTHAEIEESALLGEACPIMPAAARLIGHVQIRSRGTIGGSIAHADPAAEWPMVLTALGAELAIAAETGERVTAPADFFLGYLTTSLAPAELLTEIRVPLPPAGHGWSVQEVCRRFGDFALVAVAAIVALGGGRVVSARLVVGGVGGAPVDASEIATGLLVGSPPREGALEEVGRRVAATLEPDSDLHAPAEYRKEVAEVLCARALAEAIGRAGPG